MIRFTALLALLLPLAAHAGFDEGSEAYSVGDYTRAMVEFQAAAEQGDPRAEYYVGFFYYRGYGVPKDFAEAAKWFGKAAAKGDSRSQYYLGKMSEKGEGAEKNLVQAHVWFSLSAKNAPSPRDAAYTREEVEKLERKMSPEQIASAKQLASQWKPEK
jgi:TPR repeat protein